MSTIGNNPSAGSAAIAQLNAQQQAEEVEGGQEVGAISGDITVEELKDVFSFPLSDGCCCWTGAMSNNQSDQVFWILDRDNSMNRTLLWRLWSLALVVGLSADVRAATQNLLFSFLVFVFFLKKLSVIAWRCITRGLQLDVPPRPKLPSRCYRKSGVPEPLPMQVFCC